MNRNKRIPKKANHGKRPANSRRRKARRRKEHYRS
ncbi:MAG: 50S ribosomal protein L37 [Planctomycetota bacterium]